MLDSFLVGSSLVVMGAWNGVCEGRFLSVYQSPFLGGVSYRDGIRSRWICGVGSSHGIECLFVTLRGVARIKVTSCLGW